MTELFAAAHAMIFRTDKILLTRRAPGRNYMPGKWDIPGGTIEKGESPEQALLREIAEETGIHVSLGPPIYIYNNMVQFPKRQTLQIVYLAMYNDGEVRLNPREHTDHRWVTLEELVAMEKINFLEELITSVPQMNLKGHVDAMPEGLKGMD